MLLSRLSCPTLHAVTRGAITCPTRSTTSITTTVAAVAAAARILSVQAAEPSWSSPPSSSPPFSAWKQTRPFEQPPWVLPRKTKGTIHFLGPTLDGLPAFLNFRKGLEHLTNIGASHKRVVDVTDLRHFDPLTTLAVEGVEWLRAPSCLSEDRLLAEDKGQVEAFVRDRYFAECAAIVQERTGAEKVISYNYRHRRIDQGTNLHDPYNFSSKPLPNFHMDNDAATAETNLRRVLGDDEASRWLATGKRWAIVNLWRPVGDVVRQWPLAVVDARTLVADRDTTPIYTLANYKTHFTALKPREGLQFYYVSDLAPEEAILFVDFDSRQQQQQYAAAAVASAATGGEERHGGGGNGTTLVGMAHGAFEDHNAPEGFPQRRSIEVRSLVLYPD